MSLPHSGHWSMLSGVNANSPVVLKDMLYQPLDLYRCFTFLSLAFFHCCVAQEIECIIISKLLGINCLLLGVNCWQRLPMMLETFSRGITLSDDSPLPPEYTSPNFFFGLQLDPPPLPKVQDSCSATPLVFSLYLYWISCWLVGKWVAIIQWDVWAASSMLA